MTWPYTQTSTVFLFSLKPLPSVLCAFRIVSKKPFPNPRSWRLLLCFLPRVLIVSDPRFRSPIYQSKHLKLTFMYGVRQGLIMLLIIWSSLEDDGELIHYFQKWQVKGKEQAFILFFPPQLIGSSKEIVAIGKFLF